MTAEQLRK